MNSTIRSSSGGTGWPPYSLKNLTPLSSGGLWEAEKLVPAVAPSSVMNQASSGVVTSPSGFPGLAMRQEMPFAA